MAKIIRTEDGQAFLQEALETGTRYLYPKNPPYFTLEEMQAAVGGYIEFIHLPDNEILVIDEEGKLKGKQLNWNATYLAHAHNAIYESDYIAGDALYCDPGEIDPN